MNKSIETLRGTPLPVLLHKQGRDAADAFYLGGWNAGVWEHKRVAPADAEALLMAETYTVISGSAEALTGADVRRRYPQQAGDLPGGAAEGAPVVVVVRLGKTALDEAVEKKEAAELAAAYERAAAALSDLAEAGRAIYHQQAEVACGGAPACEAQQQRARAQLRVLLVASGVLWEACAPGELLEPLRGLNVSLKDAERKGTAAAMCEALEPFVMWTADAATVAARRAEGKDAECAPVDVALLEERC